MSYQPWVADRDQRAVMDWPGASVKDLAPSAELRKWIDRHGAMRIEFKYDRKRREEESERS